MEGTLGEALTTILRSTEPVRLVVAGRTDAGVHARGQVAHADIEASAWDAVSGRSASRDVPVHVIASREALLRALGASGFRSGLAPERRDLDAAEQLFADILDPNTGEPVLVRGTTLLVTPAYRHAAHRLQTCQ